MNVYKKLLIICCVLVNQFKGATRDLDNGRFILCQNNPDTKVQEYLLLRDTGRLTFGTADLHKNEYFSFAPQPNTAREFHISYNGVTIDTTQTPNVSTPYVKALVLEVASASTRLTVKASPGMYDRQSFVLFEQKSGSYAVCCGEVFLSRGLAGECSFVPLTLDGGNIPDRFLFQFRTASDIYAGLADDAFKQLAQAQADNAAQIQAAKEAKYNAMMEVAKTDIASATDDDIAARTQKLSDMTADNAALEAKIAQTNADADAMAKQAADLEAARQQQASQIADATNTLLSQFPQFDLKNSTLDQIQKDPKYAALTDDQKKNLQDAKAKMDILNSSQSDMIQRFQADATTIAANAARNLSAANDNLKLEQQKALAVLASERALNEAKAAMASVQDERLSALTDAFNQQKTEITAQITILQQQLDQVNAENVAMAAKLKELQDQQNADQATKNAAIASLAGLVYAPDLFTPGEVMAAGGMSLADIALKMATTNAMGDATKQAALLAQYQSLSKTQLLQIGSDSIKQLQSSKLELVDQMNGQIQTLQQLNTQITANNAQIQAAKTAIDNLNKAKEDAKASLIIDIVTTLSGLNAVPKDYLDLEDANTAAAAALTKQLTDLKAQLKTASDAVSAETDPVAAKTKMAARDAIKTSIQGLIKQKGDLATKFQTDSMQKITDMAQAFIDNGDYTKLKGQLQSQIDALTASLATTPDAQKPDVNAKITAFQGQIGTARDAFIAALTPVISTFTAKTDAYFALIQKNLTDLAAQKKSFGDSFDAIIAKFKNDGQPASTIQDMQDQETALLAKVDDQMKTGSDELNRIATLKSSVCTLLSTTQVQLGRDSASAVNDQINALQQQKATQSADIAAATDAQIKKMQQSSADAQAALNSAHDDAMKAIQDKFDASAAANQATIDNIQASTNKKLADGKAQLATMAAALATAQGADAAAMSQTITNLQAQTDAMSMQLAQEKQNTVDAISKALDAKKAIQDAQAQELSDRAAWIKDASDKSMAILQALAAQAEGAQKDALTASLNSTQANFDSQAKSASDAAAAQQAQLQTQIQAIQDQATAQQAALTKDINDANTNYAAQRSAAQAQYDQQIAAGQADLAAKTKAEMDAADTANNTAIAALQASLQAQIDKAKQAQADAKDAADKNLAMLQQQLIDVQGSANVLSLNDGESVGLAHLGDSDHPNHLQVRAGQIAWNSATRFDPTCTFKIAKQQDASFAIQTSDGKSTLTLDATDPKNPKLTFAAIPAAGVDSATQTFFFQKVDSPLLMTQISTHAKDGFLVFDPAGLKIAAAGDDFKIDRFGSDKGTIEGLLTDQLKDATLLGTKNGLDVADQYFVSTQVFSSQTKLKDFVYALEDYVDCRYAVKLFNEAAASRLDTLRTKVEKFVTVAQTAGGQSIIDKAVLDSLDSKAQMLDPVQIDQNNIVFIKIGQEYLTTQVEKLAANASVLMAQKHVFDQSMAFKAIKPDPNTNSIALVCLTGNLTLGSAANNDLSVTAIDPTATPSAIGAANMFQYSGTRKAANIVQGANVLSIVKDPSGKNYAALSADKTTAANFELEVYDSTTFEYALVTKGLASYSGDANSLAAMDAICLDLKTRLKDPKVNSAMKSSMIDTFISYLGQPVVNTASQQAWSQEVGLIVELIIENLSADIAVDQIDQLLSSVESVSLKEGQLILLSPSSEDPSSYLKAEATGIIASLGLNMKAFFRVVAFDVTGFGLVTYDGKYLAVSSDPTVAGVIISADVALDGDTVVKKPTDAEIFRVSGTTGSIFLKPQGLQGTGDTSGFVAIDKNDTLVCRQTSGQGGFFDEADVRAKFRVEIYDSHSPKIAIAKGDFANVPSAFFISLDDIHQSTASDDDKATQAAAVIKDLYTTIIKTVTAASGAVTLAIKDECMPLVSVADDDDKGTYSMASALDLINKRIKYDPMFVKDGIKLSDAAVGQLKDLATEFVNAQGAASAGAPVVTGDPQDPFVALAKTPQAIALYLDSLWIDKKSVDQGARIWHSYLTKVCSLLYGKSFDDNTNLFGMDWSGQIMDGTDAYVLTRETATIAVGDQNWFPTDLRTAAGKAFTKTYPLSVDAVVDENGLETAPATVNQEPISFGLNLFFDASGAVVLKYRHSSVTAGTTLSLDNKKQLLDILNSLKASKAPIVANNPAAVAFLTKIIKDLSDSINFIETGIAGNIGQRIIQLVGQISDLNFTGKYADSEKVATTFVKAPKASMTTPAAIAKALVQEYSKGTPVYIDFLSIPQKNALKVLRDDNKASIARDKAAAAKAKALAAKAAAKAKIPAKKGAAKPAPAKKAAPAASTTASGATSAPAPAPAAAAPATASTAPSPAPSATAAVLGASVVPASSAAGAAAPAAATVPPAPAASTTQGSANPAPASS